MERNTFSNLNFANTCYLEFDVDFCSRYAPAENPHVAWPVSIWFWSPAIIRDRESQDLIFNIFPSKSQFSERLIGLCPWNQIKSTAVIDNLLKFAQESGYICLACHPVLPNHMAWHIL